MTRGRIALSFVLISLCYTFYLEFFPSFFSAGVKTLPILLLAAAAWRWAAPGWRWPLTAALLFSALGDLLLALDQLQGGLFEAGLASFLIAQVLYASVFWRHRSSQPGRRWLALAYLAAAAVLAWLILPEAGAHAVPVGIYLLGITAMVTGAALTDRPLLLFAGALCFAASDTLIAVNKFLLPLPAAGILIMASYYLAQGLICTGSLRAPASQPA